MRRPVRRPRPLVTALGLAAALLATVAGPALAGGEFPDGWKAFHTYDELAARVAAVEAAHPAIVDRFSIGESYKGRKLWAAKVSDNVALDEDEPEVLFDGLHHADEHMSLEMTLAILRWLTDGYGSDDRITDIVDSREIWIVFAVNPDGAEFDIKDGRFQSWRKNRQPNSNGTVGTDLNRNYSYQWGGGGRTSSNPRAITYRGPRAFSAPETRAMRDFLASRVVGGRQQIRAGITFHESGRLVMWPYGYTHKDIPADMTSDDHAALRKIGRHMAASNGYRPQQASELYISSGTSRDYLYGTYRVFSYTFELSIRAYPRSSVDRPRDLAQPGGRAVPHGAGLVPARRAGAGGPRRALRRVRRRSRGRPRLDGGSRRDGHRAAVGPLAARQPRVGRRPAARRSSGTASRPGGTRSSRAPRRGPPPAPGTSTAARRSAPAGSSSPTRPASRSRSAGCSRTRAARPPRPTTSGPSSRDRAGRRPWCGSGPGSAAAATGSWGTASVSLDAWAGDAIRIRFEALDGATTSIVEAGIDDVRVTRPGG